MNYLFTYLNERTNKTLVLIHLHAHAHTYACISSASFSYSSRREAFECGYYTYSSAIINIYTYIFRLLNRSMDAIHVISLMHKMLRYRGA